MNSSPPAPEVPDTSGTVEFRLLRCGQCRRWIHPIERQCSDHPDQAHPERAASTGTVYSFTVNHHAYLQDIELPYVVAMVDLDEPSPMRVTTRLATSDVASVAVGTRVRACEGSDGTRVPTFEVT